MKLMFKQKLFSWFSSYDVFDEDGSTVFKVRGELAWGHKLRIYDAFDREVGLVKQKVFSFLPKFEVYSGDEYIGCITKELTLFKPRFSIDFNGWQVKGDFFQWDYEIVDSAQRTIADISKQLWNLTDTYSLDVHMPGAELYVLMLVIAIDAEKASRNA